jgi:hypothetical protein
MKGNPDVEAWFAAKKPPNEELMRRIREILLAAVS